MIFRNFKQVAPVKRRVGLVRQLVNVGGIIDGILLFSAKYAENTVDYAEIRYYILRKICGE